MKDDAVSSSEPVASALKISELLKSDTITGVTIIEGSSGWKIRLEAPGLVSVAVGDESGQIRYWPDLGAAANHVVEKLGIAYFEVEVSGEGLAIAMVGREAILRRRKMAAGYQGLRMRYRSFPNET